MNTFKADYQPVDKSQLKTYPYGEAKYTLKNEGMKNEE